MTTMQKRKLGNSNIEASVIGLGTWAMGGWRWGGGDDVASINAIKAALDCGITLIDTAPAYGMGRAEDLVGKAVEGSRDKVVIATKCGLVWDTDKGRPFVDQDGKKIHRYLGAESIVAEVEASLKRLRTDYIDVYISHWQDPTTPVAETMEAFERLLRDGKIRSIGVSNVSQEDLEAYLAVGPIGSIQERFSMLDRAVEKTLLPICAKHNISMLSYSSLANGLLSGHLGPEREFKGDDLRIGKPRFEVENRTRVASFFTELKSLMEQKKIGPSQLVIGWTLAQPGITYALCGARTPEQVMENASAGAVQFTAQELASIDKAIATHLSAIPA